MNSHVYAVIMAGGVGSRFWPLSRNAFPKQFHDMLGLGRTLIQATYQRFAQLVPPEQIYVVTNTRYRPLVEQQLPELGRDQVLYEPVGRNTAPCIAYATHRLRQQDPEAVLVVSPSDHLILNEAQFLEDLRLGVQAATEQKRIVTLGISPNRPDTGFGYIQYLDTPEASGVYKVKTFTEKPSLDIAQKFIASGDFVWNAGIFIFHNQTMLQALATHMPELNELFVQVADDLGGQREPDAIQEVYSKCKNISVDYGIMEKADNVYVIRSEIGWSDLGAWNSLHEQMDHDDLGNTVLAEDLRLHNTQNSLIRLPKGKLGVVRNVQNLIIVDTEDALLISTLDDEQAIKQVVADLKKDPNSPFL